MFQEARAKQGNAIGTATEHAIGGTATEHAASAAGIEDSRGPATDGALSASKFEDCCCTTISSNEVQAGEVIKFMVEHGFEIFDCFDSRYDSAGNHVQMDMTFIKANSKFQPVLKVERVDVSAA